MSSFAIVTETGVPEVLVEIGKPITTDTVLMTGIFQAIEAVTKELSNTHLQLIQSENFTVRFKYLEVTDSLKLLMVGTTDNVYGLEDALHRIEVLLHGVPLSIDEAEDQIRNILKELLSHTVLHQENSLSLIGGIPKDISSVLFWAVLSGYNIDHPSTYSLDLNRDLIQLLTYLNFPFGNRREAAPSVNFDGKGWVCTFNGKRYNKAKNLVPSLKIVNRFVSLINKGEYNELKALVDGLVEQLESYEQLFETFLDGDDQHKSKLDLIRYSMGIELEYFLFQRLEISNPAVVEHLRSHTKNFDWIKTW